MQLMCDQVTQALYCAFSGTVRMLHADDTEEEIRGGLRNTLFAIGDYTEDQINKAIEKLK